MAKIKGSPKTGGRQKGDLNKSTEVKKIAEAEAKALLVRECKEDLQKIIIGLIELAKGIHREEFKKDGQILRYYKEKPDIRAIEIILHYLIGKPTENVRQYLQFEGYDTEQLTEALTDRIAGIVGNDGRSRTKE
jgi:hypothetical protein